MMICVYCETVSDFPTAYCFDCNEYDGIVPFEGDPDDIDDIEYFIAMYIDEHFEEFAGL